MSHPPDYCPECGAEVPDGAKACPECGSCEATGWSERAQTTRLGIPDPEFDYDEYVGREFGGRQRGRTRRSKVWGIAALVLILLLLLGALGGLF